jgi:hypothetical protein
MKPHKRNGPRGKKRRQEAAKDRLEKGRQLLKAIFADMNMTEDEPIDLTRRA